MTARNETAATLGTSRGPHTTYLNAPRSRSTIEAFSAAGATAAKPGARVSGRGAAFAGGGARACVRLGAIIRALHSGGT
jgi:hypothetical protein